METVIRTKVKDLLKSEAGKDVLAKGWVRTKRGNKNVAFIALNDGSTINNIQIVVDKTPENEAVLAKVSTGACIAVWGKLVESMGGGQATEIQAPEIEVYGECDPVRYPLQKKDTSFEFLRTVAHLRPRTNTFGAIYRIRNQMAFAIHQFFLIDEGYLRLHHPELCQVARGITVLCTESRTECIDFSKSKSSKLTFKLAAYSKAGLLAKEVLCVVDSAFLVAWEVLHIKSCHAEHLTGSLAV